MVLREYSDGCICKKKGEKLSLQDIEEVLILTSIGAEAGAAAVRTNMTRRKEESLTHCSGRDNPRR